jgi:hypothetical protein
LLFLCLLIGNHLVKFCLNEAHGTRDKARDIHTYQKKAKSCYLYCYINVRLTHHRGKYGKRHHDKSSEQPTTKSWNISSIMEGYSSLLTGSKWMDVLLFFVFFFLYCVLKFLTVVVVVLRNNKRKFSLFLLTLQYFFHLCFFVLFRA